MGGFPTVKFFIDIRMNTSVAGGIFIFKCTAKISVALVHLLCLVSKSWVVRKKQMRKKYQSPGSL